MLAKRLVGAVIAAALLVPTTAVVVAAATPIEYGVHLVSTDYWYTDTTLTAVGDVRNDTDVPVRGITIRASALAADGSVVATNVGDAWLEILDPGEASSFKVDVTLPRPFDSYRIAVEDWSYTGLASNHYFTTTASASAVDQLTTRVTGSITNVNVVPAGENIVVATLYDATGKVVGSAGGFLTGTLAPGESMQYVLSVAHLPISFTPTLAVTAESTSEPRTGVTFAVAPTDLAYGGKVSITGAAKPGASVTFELYDQPTAAWVDAGGGPITAGADGSFAVTATPTAGSSYRAVSGGVQSVPVVIFVRTKVTMRASTKSTTVGKKVTFSGTARPADASTEVIIQRKVGSAWKKVASGPISGGGTFKVAWTPKAKGTYVLRAWVSGGAVLYPGTSSTITIVVK